MSVDVTAAAPPKSPAATRNKRKSAVVIDYTKLPFAHVVPDTGDNVTDSPVFRSKLHPNEFLLTVKELGSPKTVCEAYMGCYKKFANRKCHGTRHVTDEADPLNKVEGWDWLTYKEVGEHVERFGSGLRHLDLLKPDTDGTMKLMGLMGRNHSHWVIAEQACLTSRGTTVPIYTTTPNDSIVHVLNQNSCATITCDVECARRLVGVKPSIPALTTLIVYGYRTPKERKEHYAEIKEKGEAVGLKILAFDEVVEVGKANPSPMQMPEPKDIFSFCYTSGSSGMPKGVITTHEAQMSTVAAVIEKLVMDGPFANPTMQQTHISYMPLAHVMERSNVVTLTCWGGTMGFSRGTREGLLDDIAAMRPTIFPTVPRLLNLIRDKVLFNVNSKGGLVAKLFHTGLKTKIANVKRHKYSSAFWDGLVFNKVKKRIGLDRCKLMVSGSAPISFEVINFFRALVGCPVVEGYGSSEMTLAVSMQDKRDVNILNVGGPVGSCEFKLRSVPDVGYLVSDREHNGIPVLCRGEILARGPSRMVGYYRQPEATRDAIDKDGWYCTGDLGVVLMSGSLKIADRVRNTFKLSIGEYVTPEKVENIVCTASLVMQAFVHGDSFHNKLVAIIVPDPDAAKKWAADNGLSGAKLEDLCKNADFVKAVQKQVEEVGKAAKLASFEVPKSVFLEPNAFSVDNGLLTPTFKMKRDPAKKMYAEKLAELLGPQN